MYKLLNVVVIEKSYFLAHMVQSSTYLLCSPLMMRYHQAYMS